MNDRRGCILVWRRGGGFGFRIIIYLPEEVCRVSKKKVADKPQGNKGARGWESRFRERDEASWSRGAKAAAASRDKSVEKNSPTASNEKSPAATEPLPQKPEDDASKATRKTPAKKPQAKKESSESGKKNT